MTEIADTAITAAPVHPALGRGWIDLTTAARRSGRSIGHLRRQAAALAAASAGACARQIAPPGGGKPTWFIAETAAPEFAAVKFAEQITADQFAGRGEIDLRQVPDAKRKTAESRLRVLRRWSEAVRAAFTLGYGRDAATGRFLQQLLIDEGIEVSRATLYGWERRWRAEGLAGLLDGRGAKPKANEERPFVAEVQRLYLSLRQPKLTKCYELAAHAARQNGWDVVSYKTCQRAIDALPRGVLIRARLGEDAYKEQAEPWLPRDYTSLVSNEAWNADHHQFDVLVNCGGQFKRPWLSAFQDVRSRKIMGWVIVEDNPNSDTILSVFRQAVLAHGVPERLFIDNGKDYDAYVFNGRTKKDRWRKRRFRFDLDERAHGLWNLLAIDPRHVWPWHGQSKPIERWFGELEQNTFVWPTFCGNCPANKPEARTGPMRGEDLQLNLERGNAPTLADFTAWFGDWLTQHEASHAHSGDGMDGQTPDAVYAANLHAKRTTTPELLELYCMRRVGPLKVHQNGITWQHLSYGQFEPSLHQRLGRQVMLAIDDRDVTSSVQVFDLDGRPVCVAPLNAKLPFIADAQDLRNAIKTKRQDSKVLRDYVHRRTRLADDLPQRLIDAAAEKARRKTADAPPPTAPNLKPIQTVIDEDLKGMQTLVEQHEQRQSMRIAVGAENASTLDLSDLRRSLQGDDENDGGSILKLRGSFASEE